MTIRTFGDSDDASENDGQLVKWETPRYEVIGSIDTDTHGDTGLVLEGALRFGPVQTGNVWF
jgi:hypothetical protein